MVWEIEIDEWSDDGRTSLRVSNNLFGGVKKIMADENPIDRKICSRKINGWDE